jgi:hypothetical protein
VSKAITLAKIDEPYNPHFMHIYRHHHLALCQVSSKSIKKSRRICVYKSVTSRWTDGRTDGRTERVYKTICLPMYGEDIIILVDLVEKIILNFKIVANEISVF